MIIKHKENQPLVLDSVFVAENATVIGKVTLEREASIWFGAVLRGDVEAIKIGQRSNIQDNAVVHTSNGFPTTVGDDVTVGHGAIVHGCTIGNRVLVGMGAIILDGAVIEDDCMIGAGTLVPPGKTIPSGHLAVGSPAKIMRELTEAEKQSLKDSALRYATYASTY